MANREALRELQTRLASRLLAARTAGLTVSWLAVRAGGINYLFPLAQSGEIFPLVNLQAVPYVRPWFRGVVNLRGALHGVVDLAGFVRDEPVVRSEQSLSETSVITLNAALEVNCALLVDALAGLRNADAFSGSMPPETDAPVYFGRRYAEPGGDHWQEINLQILSQLPQFLSIGG
jgi:twitching motility protein PilI